MNYSLYPYLVDQPNKEAEVEAVPRHVTSLGRRKYTVHYSTVPSHVISLERRKYTVHYSTVPRHVTSLERSKYTV